MWSHIQQPVSLALKKRLVWLCPNITKAPLLNNLATPYIQSTHSYRHVKPQLDMFTLKFLIKQMKYNLLISELYIFMVRWATQLLAAL